MKDVLQNIFFTIVILLFVISCTDMYKGCNNMPEQTVGTGEIVNDALIWFNLTTNLDIFDSEKGQVITSDSENIFDLVVSFDNGETYQPIDFSKYSVLGKNAVESCRVVFDRNVTKHAAQQKYIYKITVIHCGDCQKLATNMNWVLIPKIEDDFSVEFVMEFKRWKGK